MPKAEFVMLAHNCDRDDRVHFYTDYYWSEKLDGMRGFWDGGITRGEIVPWQPGVKATGLWTRNMNSVIAPDSWLDRLPPIPLDGELYMRRKMHQETISIVSRTKNVIEHMWRFIKFPCFDSPGLETVWTPRTIDNPNCHVDITPEIHDYMYALAAKKNVEWRSSLPFYRVLDILESTGFMHEQHNFSLRQDLSMDDLHTKAAEISDLGGEGIVVRSAFSLWSPERSWDLLKIKPLQDAEAKVIGYTFGSETDLGSKLLGMLGTLIVEWAGKTFKLGPFVDSERLLVAKDCFQAVRYNGGKQVTDFHELARRYASEHPEGEAPDWITAVNFPIGTSVTFRYRELTKAGAPVEAKYWRKRID